MYLVGIDGLSAEFSLSFSHIHLLEVLVTCWISVSSQYPAWYVARTASFLTLSLLTTVASRGNHRNFSRVQTEWRNRNHPQYISSSSCYVTPREYTVTIRSYAITSSHPNPPFVRKTHWKPLSSLPSPREERGNTLCQQDTAHLPQLPPACSNHLCLSPDLEPKFPGYPAYFKCSTLCSKRDNIKIKHMPCHLNLSSS